MKQIPHFMYHPDPFATGVFLDDQSVICDCCAKTTDVYYDNGMYSIEEVAYLCPACIASGAAAEKFDGTFIQDADQTNVTDIEKQDILFKRTPGFPSWQGEYWLSCCHDFCAYLGTIGTKELEQMGIADDIFADYIAQGGMPFAREYLEKDGSLCGYLFQCLHCGKYHLYADAD